MLEYISASEVARKWGILERRVQKLCEERDKAVMRKLDTLVAYFPDTDSLMEQDEISKTYSVPKLYISYCKPRTVSTEQREWARQMVTAKKKAKGI